MSARRKTLLANEIQNFETDLNDDEAEKRQRVAERVENQNLSVRNRRRTILPDEATPGQVNKIVANGTTPQAPKPSNEQLSCLYNNCVKLLNENKINVKNAFQLKLIDYMSEIVLNKEIVGGVTNFQVVGCTIDVGTKIYAARVDALHQNTYQVLSGLGNSAGDDQENNNEENNGMDNDNDDDNNIDDDRQNNKKAKTKKKRMKKSSQIAQNLDSITSKMKDEFKDEDLYFAKISTCIENEAISGILLNKLHVQNDSNKILINADDQKYSGTNDYTNNETLVNCESIYDFYVVNGTDFRNMKLCADLNSFKFIDWNLENDDISKLVEDTMHNASDQVLEEHRFDANNKQLHALDATSDIGSTPMDNEFEDFGHDFNGDDVEHIEMFMNAHDAPKLMEQHKSGLDLLEKIDDIHLNSVADLTSLISHAPSDYSYFNLDKLKLQTLPKHLKQIAAHLANNSENNSNDNMSEIGLKSNTQKSTTVRNKKIIPKIDLLDKIDRMKFFKITKKAIYLCDRTIEKRSEKPFRLEAERQIDYNAKQLLQPYLKPIPAKVLCDIECVENLLINDDEIVGLNNENHRNKNQNHLDFDDDDGHLGGIDDNFEIPCTAQSNEPFYSQHGGEFIMQTQFTNANDLDQMLMPPPSSDLMNMSHFDGDNLIQAPMQVNALNIEYAKTSKNIDVRRLKLTIWNLLSNSNNKENDDTSSSFNESLDGKPKSQEQKINASLKEIYRQLKPPIISQRVFDDLSICIVFQMILFLANEHNLLLKNDPIGSDVMITNQF